MHAHLDRFFTKISKFVPIPLIAYNNIRLSLGFYTLVVIEDVESYHRFIRPQRGWFVIDAGAHVGVYTVEAAKLVGDEGEVVAIEPDPDNFKMLKFHIALNKLKNVHPLRLALGSRLGYTKLLRYITPHNVISDILNIADNNTHVTIVPITTIDYVCEKLALKDVDLMKLDVEGSELEVIQGMQRVLPQYIVGEWHGTARLHKLRAFLQEKGYRTVYSSSTQNLGVFYARHTR